MERNKEETNLKNKIKRCGGRFRYEGSSSTWEKKGRRRPRPNEPTVEQGERRTETKNRCMCMYVCMCVPGSLNVVAVLLLSH